MSEPDSEAEQVSGAGGTHRFKLPEAQPASIQFCDGVARLLSGVKMDSMQLISITADLDISRMVFIVCTPACNIMSRSTDRDVSCGNLEFGERALGHTL